MSLFTSAKKSNLTHLYLDNNLIQNEGALFFAKALKNNTTLEYLYLTHNRIGYQGLYSLAEVL